MQIDGDPIVSASDLNSWLACRHLSHLDLQRALGLLREKPTRDPNAEMLRVKGDRHELDYLEGLKSSGLEVAEMEMPESSTAGLRQAARETASTMRSGPDVIFQGNFFENGMRGHTDFLFRVDRPSELGDWSYEVADTKLAKNPKPYFLIQLCFYSELLEAVQGGGPPENVRVILGDSREARFRLDEFSAYFRRIKSAFVRDLKEGFLGTYPDPVSHCAICGWRDFCEDRRKTDDHLSLVAGIRRSEIDALNSAGVMTMAELGQAESGLQVESVRPARLKTIQTQAALQVTSRETGELDYRLLEPENRRGLGRLPEPNPGDIFFDFEGDPLYEDRGLEYLFGFVTVDTGEPEFSALWGRDYVEEKAAFEQFVDYVVQRRKRYPGLHVYHYAPYEVIALKRLAGAHASRELQVDQLLRENVFVDLYHVVKGGVLISQPSYSIKKVEAFYMKQRDTAVTDGGDSVVQFEQWLESGDQEILDNIEAYNKDDCVSTWLCREWLLKLREEAKKEFSEDLAWFTPDSSQPSEEALELYEENRVLAEELRRELPDDPEDFDAEQKSLDLMANLIDYHQREARPAWWSFFDNVDKASRSEDGGVQDFTDDPDCVGGLVSDGTEPIPNKRSLVYRLRFEPQETKLGPGGAIDPATGQSAGTVLGISPAEGWLEIKRGPSLADVPVPLNLVPSGPYTTPEQRGALRRLAESIVNDGLEAPGRYQAARQMLRRVSPTVEGVSSGQPLTSEEPDVEELKNLVQKLGDSYLFIQGPPGAGKTYTGSHLIVDLITAGHRIGVTANSHKAIHNLLHDVEKVALEQGAELKGLKKSSGAGTEFESRLGDDALIGSTNDNDKMNQPSVSLTAGTAWYYCREEVEPVDYLFIDEAGQISIADALALATSARNVVLLGDPQQLPQVAQGKHPDGAADSILEHLLGDHQVIPRESGALLSRTYRLHPEICQFVSELMYEGRLHSAPGMEHQEIKSESGLGGSGLRWMPIHHEGNSQSSLEEAEAIAADVGRLLASDATFFDSEGVEHPLTAGDICVVSPYNAQVRCLRETIPEGVQVGTVDKFQGQTTQIVYFSMATSSGDLIPRNIEFLFSRNRLNVAISRARCLAKVVASPRLLDIQAKSVNDMRLVNSLCRFVEVAEPATTPNPPETQTP